MLIVHYKGSVFVNNCCLKIKQAIFKAVFKHDSLKIGNLKKSPLVLLPVHIMTTTVRDKTILESQSFNIWQIIDQVFVISSLFLIFWDKRSFNVFLRKKLY